MRATWHFVTPADIRWLLALTAPRVRAAVAYYDRQLGITPAVITRANRAIAAALAGGAQLTRAELKAVLTGAAVRVDGTQRLAHVIMHAELDAVICSGARRGKQFTYALLDDRAPATSLPAREDGLGRAGAAVFHQPRAGPAQGLRVVVRADDRGGTRRPGDVAAPPHRGGDRRGKILARALPAGARDSRAEPRTCCRRTTSFSSPTRIGARRSIPRSGGRARDAVPMPRRSCSMAGSSAGGDEASRATASRSPSIYPDAWAAPMPVWWRRRRAGTGTFWARMS